MIGTGRWRFAVITADDERAERRCMAFVHGVRNLGCPDPLTINVGASRMMGRQVIRRVSGGEHSFLERIFANR